VITGDAGNLVSSFSTSESAHLAGVSKAFGLERQAGRGVSDLFVVCPLLQGWNGKLGGEFLIYSWSVPYYMDELNRCLERKEVNGWLPVPAQHSIGVSIWRW